MKIEELFEMVENLKNDKNKKEKELIEVEKETLPLIDYYYNLLMEGLSFEQLKDMIIYDAVVYMKKQFSLIDNELLPYKENEYLSAKTVIMDEKDIKKHRKALKTAYVMFSKNIEKQEENSLKMLK